MVSCNITSFSQLLQELTHLNLVPVLMCYSFHIYFVSIVCSVPKFSFMYQNMLYPLSFFMVVNHSLRQYFPFSSSQPLPSDLLTSVTSPSLLYPFSAPALFAIPKVKHTDMDERFHKHKRLRLNIVGVYWQYVDVPQQVWNRLIVHTPLPVTHYTCILATAWCVLELQQFTQDSIN